MRKSIGARLRDLWLAIPCAHCGAKAGDDCVTVASRSPFGNGARTSPHAARREPICEAFRLGTIATHL